MPCSQSVLLHDNVSRARRDYNTSSCLASAARTPSPLVFAPRDSAQHFSAAMSAPGAPAGPAPSAPGAPTGPAPCTPTSPADIPMYQPPTSPSLASVACASPHSSAAPDVAPDAGGPPASSTLGLPDISNPGGPGARSVMQPWGATHPWISSGARSGRYSLPKLMGEVDHVLRARRLYEVTGASSTGVPPGT